jgi:hypothetical protein
MISALWTVPLDRSARLRAAGRREGASQRINR